MCYRKRMSGFTLIEMIVVIVVLAILGGIAIPRFLNISQNAQLSTLKSSFGTIRRAFLQYRANTGALPPDQNAGIIPPEMNPYLEASLWASPVPGGGVWNWDGPPGWVGNEGISVASVPNNPTPLTNPLFLALDQAVDDGSLTTGLLTWDAVSTRYHFRLGVP